VPVVLVCAVRAACQSWMSNARPIRRLTMTTKPEKHRTARPHGLTQPGALAAAFLAQATRLVRLPSRADLRSRRVGAPPRDRSPVFSSTYKLRGEGGIQLQIGSWTHKRSAHHRPAIVPPALALFAHLQPPASILRYNTLEVWACSARTARNGR